MEGGEVILQPLLLSEAPFKTWLGELPPEQVPRLDTAGVVDELANMFPQMERAVIEAVAESSSNSLERALEALLAISEGDSASVISLSADGLSAEERQIKEDELLALQLYQQFSSEERAGRSGAPQDADRMFAAIQQEGSATHARFQQQPEGVREALLKQLTRMRQRQTAGIKGESGQRTPARRAPQLARGVARADRARAPRPLAPLGAGESLKTSLLDET